MALLMPGRPEEFHLQPSSRDRNAAHAMLNNGEVSPAYESFTFPQAPLRSRTVGFPESGSDLGPGSFSSTSLPACSCFFVVIDKQQSASMGAEKRRKSLS
jgi:hypothetical protein